MSKTTKEKGYLKENLGKFIGLLIKKQKLLLTLDPTL